MVFIRYPAGTQLNNGMVADGITEYNSDIVQPISGGVSSSTSAPENSTDLGPPKAPTAPLPSQTIAPTPTTSTPTVGGVSYTDASFLTDTTTPAATTTPATGTTTATNPNAATPAEITQQKQLLTEYLNSSALDSGQVAAIQAIFDATVSNDATSADQLMGALEAGKATGDPYFKAQIALASDALQRGLLGQDTNLAYKEQSLQNALNDLQNDVAAGKDYLSFQQKQELSDLQIHYEQQLETTQNNLAATGFTQSSRRSRQEQLLSDVNSGLVQSTNRAYGEKQNALTNQLARGERNTAADIAYYQSLTEQGKLVLTRQAEEQIGSSNLSSLGYQGLGNVPGNIPIAQQQDQRDYAANYINSLQGLNNFVF